MISDQTKAAIKHLVLPDDSPESGARTSAAPKRAAAHNEDDIGAPPRTPRSSIWVLLLFALVAASVLAGLFYAGWIPLARQETALAATSDSIKSSIPRVSVAHPRQSPAEMVTLLPGDVQALEETTIYPRTSGYLRSFLVDIGDHVEAGQLLAEIDTPEVDQELRQAQATLGQLKAKLLTTESNMQLARTTFSRYENLLATKSITKQEYDERLATYDTSQSTVEAAKADVKAGEANVQRLTELHSFSKVYAPFAGTITTRSIEVGQLLTSGNASAQALYRLAKTNPVRIFINVPQIYASGVKLGLPAELVVREAPNRKFVGKVTRTAGAIDPITRTMLTEVQVPNEDNLLLTGSYVQVKLHVSRENPPLLVPASALLFDADGTRLAVVDAERKVHFQHVTVEGDFGTDIGISAGLTVDAEVISNPGERVFEGSKVEIATPAKKDTAATGSDKSPKAARD